MMAAIIFLSAFVGGFVSLVRKGMPKLGAFGAAFFLALLMTALMKFVFGF